MILTVTPNPCVDKTVYVDTLTPGTFIRTERYGCVPGGKGNNVSRAVKALGRDMRSLVVVGGHTGEHVVDMIRNDDGVVVTPFWVKSPTRTITTILEEPIHRQTAFFEPGSRVTEEEGRQLVDMFQGMLSDVRVVTFNGTVSDKRIAWLYRELVAIANEAGVTTILDTYGEELAEGLKSRPYMVKPNVKETEGFVGYPLDSELSRWRAIDAFHERGVELVVLSLGKEGALVSRGGERFQAVPPAIEEVNPVGSGDALVAGFAIGLLEGMSLESMARLGVAAGAANAMSWDIGHFTSEEVEALSPRVEIRFAGTHR